MLRGLHELKLDLDYPKKSGDLLNDFLKEVISTSKIDRDWKPNLFLILGDDCFDQIGAWEHVLCSRKQYLDKVVI